MKRSALAELDIGHEILKHIRELSSLHFNEFPESLKETVEEEQKTHWRGRFSDAPIPETKTDNNVPPPMSGFLRIDAFLWTRKVP